MPPDLVCECEFDLARICTCCGSILLTNGVYVWCSFVGDRITRSCLYGVVMRITAEQHDARKTEKTHA